jgi:hypothetical protein
MSREGALYRAALLSSIGAGERVLLFRILYLRFRLWLLRKDADISNAIGSYLLRCSTPLTAIGGQLSRI